SFTFSFTHDTENTEIYTLSLHDALPIFEEGHRKRYEIFKKKEKEFWERYTDTALASWREFVNELAEFEIKEAFSKMEIPCEATTDRKSTRLNSSHVKISYAVFCLKKKKK